MRTHSAPNFVRLLWFSGAFILFASSVLAQWIKKPSSDAMKRTRGLIHESFDSTAMKTEVGFSVILPPSYESSDKRYPVVYWLHGGGGNESSSLMTATSWENLYKSAMIDEVILVYPNGFRSGYMDHHDGQVMVESMIIKELIPRIDKAYRTVASFEGRAVHGFSMGSSGALKFAIKYPHLFCSAVAYGGGAINLETTKMPFVVNILRRNLAMDPKLIRKNNTYHFLEKNHDLVRTSGIEFLMICGEDDEWKETAVTFQAALEAKGIPSKLKLVPDVGHHIGALVGKEGVNAALFQDGVFRKKSDQMER